MKGMSYRKKNQWLLAGGLLCFFILYQAALKKTVQAWNLNREMKEKLVASSFTPQKLALLEEQEAGYERLLGAFRQDANTQQALLATVSSRCRPGRLLLREFPESQLKREKEYLVETNRFVLEGSFQDILQLIYHLEQKNRIGKIASVDYQVGKDRKTQRELLTATVYVQNVKKMSHEE